uniref:glycoside hydrolase family 97 C-terminal domain-containing protein n=1 Tax=uncultured Caulobacter sp. TaxID=158749 RepID=UPI0025DE44CC|nr:glycoside hydrolase family 97 C-terminal domain-containing protein [uncultured Caulobacter sp.]
MQGQVGDYVVVARQQRGAKDWFLGALIDEKKIVTAKGRPGHGAWRRRGDPVQNPGLTGSEL